MLFSGRLRPDWGLEGHLLPTGSDDREVLGVVSIRIAIIPSRQYMQNNVS